MALLNVATTVECNRPKHTIVDRQISWNKNIIKKHISMDWLRCLSSCGTGTYQNFPNLENWKLFSSVWESEAFPQWTPTEFVYICSRLWYTTSQACLHLISTPHVHTIKGIFQWPSDRVQSTFFNSLARPFLRKQDTVCSCDHSTHQTHKTRQSGKNYNILKDFVLNIKIILIIKLSALSLTL